VPVHELLSKAEQTVSTCTCEGGCTKCEQSSSTVRFRGAYLVLSLGIHSSACREKNEISSKLGALLVLRGVLDIHVDPDSIPIQTEEQIGHDTIVEPPGVGTMAGVSVERAST
jgi:DEAD/DEAH box helicase domain-containing protein